MSGYGVACYRCHRPLMAEGPDLVCPDGHTRLVDALLPPPPSPPRLIQACGPGPGSMLVDPTRLEAET